MKPAPPGIDEQNAAVFEGLRRQQILSEEQIQELLAEHKKTGDSLFHLLRQKELVDEDTLLYLAALSHGI